MSLKSTGLALIIVLALLSSSVLVYKNAQSKIAQLTKDNIELQLSIKSQQEAIAELHAEYQQQATSLSELASANAVLSYEKTELANKLVRHDLEELSRRKPALIEKRINDGTQELFNSFSAISAN